MNNQIGLGIFGTFGEPHGFQQVFYYGANFRNSLDLNDSAIEFYPGSDLFSIRREIVDGVHSICICIYSYAQELNTTRMGTFLGSCMVLQDGFTEAEYISKVLNSMHHDLMSNEENIEDSIIKVAQGSDIIIREPAEFVAAQANLIPLNRTPFFSAYVDEEKKYLVIPSPHAFGDTEKEIADFIDEALKHYSDTGTLYFSFDKNVYEFVRNTGVIPVLEWEEFKGRKSQMQQSTAVRTKKGIQKIISTPEDVAENEASNTEQDNSPHNSDDSYKAYNYTEEEEQNNDPYKPFLLWEEPDEQWSENEVRYRVNEYNRLFNYTNTLIDHINEPYPEESKQGRRKRLLVAAFLILLISGSVAVYFLGLYKPMLNPGKLAGGPETPRTIQQSNIVTDSIAAVSAVDSSVHAEMAAAREKTDAQPVAETSYKDFENELAAAEAMYKEKPATTAPISLTASTDIVSNNGKPSQVPAPVHTHTPVATTASNAATGAAETSSMPQINMPEMPRANLPASALYTGKVKPDPAWMNTATNTPATTSTTPTASTSKIAIADAASKQVNNMPPGIVTTAATSTTAKTTAATAQPVAGTKTAPVIALPATATQLIAGKTAPVTVQPVTDTKTTAATAQSVTGTKAVPVIALPATSTRAIAGNTAPATTTQPIVVASVAPTALNKAGTTGAVQLPTSNTVAQPTSVAGITNSAVPAAAKSITATNVSSVTPAQQVSLNATPLAGSARPAGLSSLPTQPITPKRDSNKPVAGTSAGTTSNTLSPFGNAPVSSGVSSGEMDRANAVVLPQLKTSPDPEQLKLKTLYPRPNGSITQRDIPILSQAGIKNKTLTQLVQLIMENAPEAVGQYYKGQELQYAAALLNNNRQAFQRKGNDYICTGDYLMLHIPAIIKPKRPASFPK